MSRRVVMLAAICAALWGLSFIEPGVSSTPSIAFTLPALADMQRIELRAPGQDAVVLARRGDAWFVGDAPLERHAQAALQKAFTQPTPMDARVEGEPAQYGLMAQTLTATLGETTIRIGKVVDGRHTFIQTQDGDIYRARGNLRRLLDRPAHTWPERRIFALPDDGVTGLALSKGERVIWSFEKTGEAWAFTQGGRRLDARQAAGLAHMLATLRVERFVPPTEFAVVTRVSLQTVAGPRTLALGALEGRSALGRVEGRPAVFRVPKPIIELLDLPASALEDRRLFTGDPATVTAMQIGGLRVARDAPGWRAALMQLTALSTPSVVPPDAFADPEVALILERADAPWTLTLGAPYQRGARYARTSDGQTVILGPATLRELQPPVLDGP